MLWPPSRLESDIASVTWFQKQHGRFRKSLKWGYTYGVNLVSATAKSRLYEPARRSNSGDTLKPHLPTRYKIEWESSFPKGGGGRVNSPGYGNNGGDMRKQNGLPRSQVLKHRLLGCHGCSPTTKCSPVQWVSTRSTISLKSYAIPIGLKIWPSPTGNRASLA
jgi:hypothetical protein